jgi:two-component system, LytTR family, response regulator
MLIHCIAIEDEPPALKKIEGFISRIPELRLERSFNNAVEAVGWLKENNIDLIFLDVQMDMLTGIEFIESAVSNARIIITSAYDQYAVKGFELNVTDYLLKPYSFQRFVQAVNKVFDFYSVKKDDHMPTEDGNRYMFIKTEYRHERVDFDDIMYVEGMKDYLRIVCRERKIMTLMSFAKIEELLPSAEFCRVHKSYLVALTKIRSVERGVINIADQKIPVSNTYKDNFYSKIKL